MTSIPRTFLALLCVGAGAWLALAPAEVSGQGTGTVTGQIVDGASMRPLAEAQVSITGTGLGSLSNSSGRYLIVGVPAGQITVRAELIGYESQTQTVTITPDGAVTVDFQLSQTAIALDELVVTGTGVATERRALGTQVEVLGSQAIAEAPVQTVEELLQGRVAGAAVSASSSQPGTGNLIQFRGTKSVFADQTPVIYVDGIRVDTDQSTAAGTGGEQSSALADLLTTDIERIEVTKGGAASTLYGSDAANGVIQIFTRKGTPGAPRVTARMEQGVETPELKYIFDAGVIFPSIVEAGEAPATFMEDNYFQNGHTQSYYVGVNGGSSEITYNASGRLSQSDGTQPMNGSVIYNLNGGAQARVSDALSLDFSGSFVRSDYDRVFNGTAIADPLTTFEVGDALFFSGAADLDEALRIFLLPTITEEINRFRLGGTVRYNPSDRIGARMSIGVDSRTNQQRVFEPIGFTPGEVTGELTRFQREFTSVSLDAAVTYSYPLDGDITSRFTVGAQGFRDDESIVTATGTTFALPGAPDFGVAAEIDASEANSEVFNGGVYFDEQLAFWNKLFLGVGLRLDAGSTFGDEVQTATYPKVTGSYILSEEEFFQDGLGGVVDELKLRVAYGETGNFPPPFVRDRSFDAIPFRGESAPRFDNPGNPDLKPEKTSTIEAGFDAALFNNRMGLSFTWFDATTTDAFFAVPEQPVSGLGTQLRNIGEIANEGIELEADVVLINNADVRWSVGGNLTLVDNEITDMGGAADFSLSDSGQKRVSLGMPVGAWHVTQPTDMNNDGLNDGSVRDFLYECEGNEGGGFDFSVECDGDVLRPSPTKYGSFNTSLTLFNRLSINALADWAGGHSVFDWGSVWSTFNGIYRRESIECGMTEAELADCPTNILFPVQYETDGTERGKYSQSAARSGFIYDGDWFKLREISARYRLPDEMAASLGVDRAQIFGSVRNVWIWSRNELVDPELSGVRGGGIELGSETSITASPPRTYRIGIEISF